MTDMIREIHVMVQSGSNDRGVRKEAKVCKLLDKESRNSEENLLYEKLMQHIYDFKELINIKNRAKRSHYNILVDGAIAILWLFNDREWDFGLFNYTVKMLDGNPTDVRRFILDAMREGRLDDKALEE
jgi:hypothetical protein